MDTRKKKPLPIGIQSFPRMIEGGFTYVDKTRNILDLIEMGDCYFLSRPRRFGKSLLLSTLHELFLGNRELFEGLYIANSDYKWPKHTVVRLSLSSMDTENATVFKQSLEWNISAIAEEYGISIADAPTIKTKFTALIKRLSLKNKVVILIDEYDYPLINNMNNLPLAEECRIILHVLFILLKDLNDHIRFIFITGVSKFSRTSIFSGLNNLRDLTLDKHASLLLGYTENELKTYFSLYTEQLATKKNCSEEEIITSIREWYNGYRFTKEEQIERVYNPYSVMLFLATEYNENFWAESGTPSFLAHMVKKMNYPIYDIDNAELHIEDTKTYELGTIQLIPLLWQTGYLTIKSYDPSTKNLLLTYPNLEGKTSFLSHFITSITEKKHYLRHSSNTQI